MTSFSRQGRVLRKHSIRLNFRDLLVNPSQIVNRNDRKAAAGLLMAGACGFFKSLGGPQHGQIQKLNSRLGSPRRHADSRRALAFKSARVASGLEWSKREGENRFAAGERNGRQTISRTERPERKRRAEPGALRPGEWPSAMCVILPQNWPRRLTIIAAMQR